MLLSQLPSQEQRLRGSFPNRQPLSFRAALLTKLRQEHSTTPNHELTVPGFCFCQASNMHFLFRLVVFESLDRTRLQCATPTLPLSPHSASHLLTQHTSQLATPSSQPFLLLRSAARSLRSSTAIIDSISAGIQSRDLGRRFSNLGYSAASSFLREYQAFNIRSSPALQICRKAAANTCG